MSRPPPTTRTRRRRPRDRRQGRRRQAVEAHLQAGHAQVHAGGVHPLHAADPALRGPAQPHVGAGADVHAVRAWACSTIFLNYVAIAAAGRHLELVPAARPRASSSAASSPPRSTADRAPTSRRGVAARPQPARTTRLSATPGTSAGSPRRVTVRLRSLPIRGCRTNGGFPFGYPAQVRPQAVDGGGRRVRRGCRIVDGPRGRRRWPRLTRRAPRGPCPRGSGGAARDPRWPPRSCAPRCRRCSTGR